MPILNDLFHTVFVFKIVFLMIAGFLAALIDSVVGGGGIITLPSLLAVGISPHMALGTNKLAGTFASSTSSLNYIKRGNYEPTVAKHLILWVLCSALLGAEISTLISGHAIRILVLLLILFIATYTLLRKEFGKTNQFTQYTKKIKYTGLFYACIIGFYDGFLGPGTGTMLLFLFLLLFKFDFVTAVGNGRILNFASNVGALLLFVFTKKVQYMVGLPMGLAMMLGAKIGVKLAVSNGIQYIKPLFLLVCFAFIAKLGWQIWFSH